MPNNTDWDSIHDYITLIFDLIDMKLLIILWHIITKFNGLNLTIYSWLIHVNNWLNLLSAT